jgi:hypothetical protein
MVRGTDVVSTMQAQLDDEYQPEPEPEPSRWVRSAKHYFRTDPGHRSRNVRIPGALEDFPNDDDGKKAAFSRRRYEKRWPNKKDRDLHTAVRSALNGENYIRFQPIPNKFEGFFETESDVVGAYVDQLIASGDLPFAYRDSANPSDIKVTMPTHRAAAAFRVAQSRKKVEEELDETINDLTRQYG